MSGTTYDQPCPRCGRTMHNCSSDWKPLDVVNEVCTFCGLYSISHVGIMSDKEIQKTRDDLVADELNFEDDWPAITDEEKQRCEEFDKNWYIKKNSN